MYPAATIKPPCPEGFFRAYEANRCFIRIDLDVAHGLTSREAAKAKCQEHGDNVHLAIIDKYVVGIFPIYVASGGPPGDPGGPALGFAAVLGNSVVTRF